MKKILILGTGCPKCNQLAAAAIEAADELGIAYKLIKVTDINEITSFGVMITPGLVIDGQVKVVGKVLSPAEIKEHLQ